MTHGERTYRFEALTDLWTGDLNGNQDRLITTGLLGSIRWWFEVLVRGLGGNACDPTDTKCEGRNHCAVCELFGCTGWARKFRFEVLDEKGDTKTKQIIKIKDQTFSLRFTPLRPIRDEEWALLDATLRLVADYGAIGGKTVFKPTDETHRERETHHQDYGIVKIDKVNPPIKNMNVTEVEKYVRKERWRKPEPKAKDADFSWASLKYFWCVNGKYLTRQNAASSSFNRVIERPEPKRQSSQKDSDSWIAGRRPDRKNNVKVESKKVFSFKNPARTFGFVKSKLIDFDAMKGRLTDAWKHNDWDFLTGGEIMKLLFNEEDRS